MLTISPAGKADLAWVQEVLVERHYLRRPVDPRARPLAYVVTFRGERLGLAVVGIPHATRCRGWWGYPGLPTQWQVVDLCRIWLSPRLQRGGDLCRPSIVPGFVDRKGAWRPAAASWLIRRVLERVQRDWISRWPPVYPQQPYHVLLAISYHDPKHHRGTIYRAAGAEPMYADGEGNPVPGPAGKLGWCWPLPQPDWEWTELEIARPRNLRLALAC
jgi:hypothetical protein